MDRYYLPRRRENQRNFGYSTGILCRGRVGIARSGCAPPVVSKQWEGCSLWEGFFWSKYESVLAVPPRAKYLVICLYSWLFPLFCFSRARASAPGTDTRLDSQDK